ncbi:hypothetical protein BDN67DRAFT_1013480 [Paxillus ammoniavirescens]|nr:hypothetical protein BDN67DRAFT_1013480 [Paxillus ammoniavirescens]
MPSFSCSSSIRAASQNHTLWLKVTHNLAHISPSVATHNIKGRLPKELDVLWLSDVIVSLTGSLDGQGAPPPDISRQLGLNNVSRPYIDDEDGLPKITLTPSRSLPRTSRPHAKLISLHLAYVWKTIGRRKDTANSGDLIEKVDPFSPILFLPIEALLNRVTVQFLTSHLVGRYPLIFGPWCKRLDLEMAYFPSISRSIAEIMNRSKNSAHISKCKRLIKVARSRHTRVLQASAAAISSCIGNDASEDPAEEVDGAPSVSALTDEQALCEVLEQLFRVGVPQRRFKPAAAVVPSPHEDDDDLVKLSQDDTIVDLGADHFFSWPEIARTSPPSASTDAPRTLPDDMDVFVQEDWPEDKMWRTDENTSLAFEREIPSDESLIDESDSSLPTTMPSSQAPFPTRYHENEVDSHSSNLSPGIVDLGLWQEGAFLEDPGNSALLIPSHHLAHDHHHSQSFDQVTVYQGLGMCQAHSEHFEILDSPDGVGYENSDSMLFDLDDSMTNPIAPFGHSCFSSDVTQITSTAADDFFDFCYPFGTLPHPVQEHGVKDAADDFVADLWSF